MSDLIPCFGILGFFTLLFGFIAYMRYLSYRETLALAEKGLVIGYDRRFLSPEFAKRTAEIAVGNGISVFLTDGYTPTPAVSWAVHSKKAGAGIMITASHNPPVYNGFKVKEGFGGSARPSTCAPEP